MKVGDVVVTKVTGAYAVVLELRNDGKVWVRMARGPQDNHSDYIDYYFFPEELESVEAHLRRNLAELELKQRMIEEAKDRQQKKLDLTVSPVETIN
jgi:hypothetical protein